MVWYFIPLLLFLKYSFYLLLRYNFKPQTSVLWLTQFWYQAPCFPKYDVFFIEPSYESENFFIKMRVVHCSISSSLRHRKKFLNKKVLFLYKNNFLVGKKPSDFPFSNTFKVFMTFFAPPFCFLKRREKRKMAAGAQMGSSSLCSISQIDAILLQNK